MEVEVVVVVRVNGNAMFNSRAYSFDIPLSAMFNSRAYSFDIPLSAMFNSRVYSFDIPLSAQVKSPWTPDLEWVIPLSVYL